MKKLSTVLYILLVLVIALSFTACGSTGSTAESSTGAQPAETSAETSAGTSAANGPTALKAMVYSEDNNRITLANDWYKANVKSAFPDYDVQFDMPGKGYDDKLKILNASGELPDVFWGSSIIVPTGNALDFTPYITKDGFADSFQNKAALMKFPDGRIYSISSGTDSYFTSFLGYNKTIFDKVGVKVPTNFNELVDVCRKLKAAGYIPISTQGGAIQNWMIQDLTINQDPQGYQNVIDGKAKLTDAPFLNAAKEIRQMVDEGFFPKDLAVIEYQASSDLFSQGKAAMIYCPLWQNESFKDANKDMDWIFLTSFDKSPKYLHGWGTAFNGFMVSSKGKHVDESVKLAEWLVQQDAKFFSSKQGFAVAIQGNPITAEVMPVVQSVIDLYNNPAVTTVPSFITNSMSTAGQSEEATAVGKLITGQMTPEQFCAEFQKDYEMK